MSRARLHADPILTRTTPARRSAVHIAPRPAATLQRQLGNRAFTLQRCSCGGSCAACRAKSEDRSPIQPKLTVGPAGDAFEREADQVADRVMRTPADGTAPAAITPLPAGGVQRTAEDDEEPGVMQPKAHGDSHAGQPAPPEARDLVRAPGEPLDAGTRAFMEPRFGADFGGVRIHTGASADVAARSVSARAYTVGSHVVFGAGEYAPGSDAGRRLLAHELTHVVQQGGATASPAAVQRLQRAPKVDDCAGEPKDKWITRVVVQQETPQSVTVEWSDGTTESDQCSTGKGQCCVDAATPDGVACTVAKSQTNNTNCTPITARNGYQIKSKVRDHKGINYWSEFVPSRAIALHEYTPVDGTPLSHGCVRLNTAMAKKIFCGSRVDQTWVQVKGFARPKCDHPALQQEWLEDFALAGTDVKDGDDSPLAKNIRETRKEMESAFGKSHTTAQYRALTVADIPRCTGTAPLPAAAPAGGSSAAGSAAEAEGAGAR